MCFDDFAGVAMLGYYLLGDARAEQVCCVSPVRVGITFEDTALLASRRMPGTNM